ncbi:ThiF family adenylyltransferase [Lysinibacillus xylanilyticus]|uniref:THIF-type NAD/FAD binding fold domain-containing protein n=1 Tax=Lysinibacillus xylanilyticus TaxID=582475 RepID=A0A2M9Q5S5_9BACI|nr:ThiF family adenylyltransferase [Lysinibacillus xylanilyticus]PJO43414.1 hypothetical protein CWD94_12760 [Lysinibacillus xylanilyticus]
MANIKIQIPSLLQNEVDIQAEKIFDAIRKISDEYKNISNLLFIEENISPNVILFLNHERIFDINLLLEDGDTLTLIFAISGGDKEISELNQYSKYIRQINLPNVGIYGQDKLFNSKVLLIGAGGLGTPTSMYLVAAGIGNVGIVDNDIVEESNLARQVLYTTEDIGEKKVKCLKRRLSRINETTKIDIYPTYLDKSNAEQIIRKYDLIINGSDNFKTRYIINEVCNELGKNWIDSSVLQFTGNIVTFKYGYGCYECLFPGINDSEKNCSTEGIIGPLCGIFGSLQALQALKILLEIDEYTGNYIFNYNSINESFQKLGWRKRDDCPVCGNKKNVLENNDKDLIASIEISKEVLVDYLENYKCLVIDLGTRMGLDKLAGHQILNMDPSSVVEKFEMDSKYYKDYDVIVLICPYGLKSKGLAEVLQYKKFPVVGLKGGFTSLFRVEQNV